MDYTHMDPTTKQILEILSQDKYINYLDQVEINKIYARTMHYYKIGMTLFLLNKMLEMCNCNKVQSISSFKIDKYELNKINRVKFINDNIETFNELRINNNMFKEWDNMSIVINILLNDTEYKLKSFTSTKTVNGDRKSTQLYKVETNECNNWWEDNQVDSD